MLKANDLGTAVLLEEIIKRPEQFKKLVVASSMSIYGEGAYRCAKCGDEEHPYLRSKEQLARHEWEFSCEKCGGELTPIGTAETKPLFPDIRLCGQQAGPGAVLSRGRTCIQDSDRCL